MSKIKLSPGSSTAVLETLPIRSLTISQPKTKDEVSSDLKCNVILVTKYPFTAETDNELSVNKGDILKLLDRLNNGWLLVKFIDRVQSPGLIPATYVDIAVNDPVNPVTLNWLQCVLTDDKNIVDELSYLDLQFNKVESKFVTINNKPYPIQASISNFLLYNERYWYRLDIEYSDKSKSYICRYYQDFYNLHIKLLDLMDKIQKNSDIDAKSLKLPKLPEPIPTTKSNDEGELISMLLKRCNDLNVYINKLMLNKYYQTSQELIDWLALKELPGFTIQEVGEVEELSNQDINEKILPGSINVVKNYRDKLDELEKLEKQKEIEDFKQEKLPERSKSKNIYNHYQQAAHALSHATSIRKGSVSSARSSGSPTTAHNSLIGSTTANGQTTNESSPTSSSPSPTLGSRDRNSSDPNYILASPTLGKQKVSVPTYPVFQSTPTPPLPQLNNPKLINTTTASPKLNYNPKPGYSPRIKPVTKFSSTNVNSASPKLSPLSHSQASFPAIPCQSLVVANSKHQFIKCKIVDNNGDIVAVKLDKSQIKSIQDLKNLVRLKINYRSLFIKLPNLNNFENIDIVNFNITEFLRFNDKVYLKIA
ncbi:Bud emergence protein 1 [Candida viswanathii]|uniref:Bud emergence protein 1 n=1 Tax=Candida viswanathii TaxID=5486 RepID=A0A367XR87_9ASCO|nr:Bud emergence protein 1 [Candida viswanathii]